MPLQSKFNHGISNTCINSLKYNPSISAKTCSKNSMWQRIIYDTARVWNIMMTSNDVKQKIEEKIGELLVWKWLLKKQ